MAINDGGPIVSIPLLRGGFAGVSPEDAERVLQFEWRLGRNGYVYCRNRTAQKHALLHRFIVDAEDGIQIHHINEIKTDCRRGNLMRETPSDHQKNHHIDTLISRNKSARKHPIVRKCEGCGIVFLPDRDHRGRTRYCTKACGNKNRPRPGRSIRSANG